MVEAKIQQSYRPPTHSADLVSPATCLEENENGFVNVKSKREELINALECNESFLYIVCKALDNSEGKYFLVDFKYENIPGFIAPYAGAPYGLHEHENGFKRQDAKELFNHRHSLLRSFTDKTLVALKERFPILMSAPSYPLPTQVMLVVAACALHNYICYEKPDDNIFKIYEHEGCVTQPDESTVQRVGFEKPENVMLE
ncbi:putative nuclease HARBI1 [Tanacetum coccineum]